MNLNIFAATVVILLAAAVSASAQAECVQECREIQSHCWNKGKDAKPWVGLNGGVKWEKSLEEAKRRAAGEGMPILLYQLVGDLDKEGC